VILQEAFEKETDHKKLRFVLFTAKKVSKRFKNDFTFYNHVRKMRMKRRRSFLSGVSFDGAQSDTSVSTFNTSLLDG
jgi:hypothetical protein